MAPNYKWKVQAIGSTHASRVFTPRGWPCANYKNAVENICCDIHCADEYSSAIAKSGTHAPLIVRIADYSDRSKTFRWVTLKTRAKTLDEAKALLASYLESNPRAVPKDIYDQEMKSPTAKPEL